MAKIKQGKKPKEIPEEHVDKLQEFGEVIRSILADLERDLSKELCRPVTWEELKAHVEKCADERPKEPGPLPCAEYSTLIFSVQPAFQWMLGTEITRDVPLPMTKKAIRLHEEKKCPCASRPIEPVTAAPAPPQRPEVPEVLNGNAKEELVED